MNPTCSAPPLVRPRTAEAPRATPTLSTAGLFGPARMLFIEHAGQRYTLRITRENKLILTK